VSGIKKNQSFVYSRCSVDSHETVRIVDYTPLYETKVYCEGSIVVIAPEITWEGRGGGVGETNSYLRFSGFLIRGASRLRCCVEGANVHGKSRR
jgi:hypothetical protein